MKKFFIVIVFLISLSAVIQLFEKSFLLGILFIIAAFLFLYKSIKKDNKERKILSNLSPEELKNQALEKHRDNENHQRLIQEMERNMERNKEISELKLHIKLKLGKDVNPDNNEIEIDGILFKVVSRKTRYLRVLFGSFVCNDCGFIERIIDDLSDYGYLLQKYEEHLNKCIRKT
ncbi:MAG: hypothetical protein WA126_03150 [Thermodesulfovibrionales bacterium]